MKVNDWLQTLVRLAYPPRCLLCGRPGAGNQDLCPGCRVELPYNRHACATCARPLPDKVAPGGLCGTCLQHPPPIRSAYAALVYTWTVPHLVRQLKFHAGFAAGRLLAELVGDFLEQQGVDRPQLLVPVPLHPRRLRERGFNQAMELARLLGQRFALPVNPRVCRRVRYTPPQTGLPRKERLSNLKGAFVVEPLQGIRHLALIDDVVTTGTTLNSLAQVFLASGVERVDFWAVARAGDPATATSDG